jgi:hypothetical protein
MQPQSPWTILVWLVLILAPLGFECVGLPREKAQSSSESHPFSSLQLLPLFLSGPGDNFDSSDQILPHHILGSLQDFKRIAVARGNTQVCLQSCLAERSHQNHFSPPPAEPSRRELKRVWSLGLESEMISDPPRVTCFNCKSQKPIEAGFSLKEL